MRNPIGRSVTAARSPQWGDGVGLFLAENPFLDARGVLHRRWAEPSPGYRLRRCRGRGGFAEVWEADCAIRPTRRAEVHAELERQHNGAGTPFDPVVPPALPSAPGQDERSLVGPRLHRHQHGAGRGDASRPDVALPQRPGSAHRPAASFAVTCGRSPRHSIFSTRVDIPEKAAGWASSTAT